MPRQLESKILIWNRKSRSESEITIWKSERRKYSYDRAICAGGIRRGTIRLNRMMTMRICSHARMLTRQTLPCAPDALHMAVTSERSRFSRNGAESGTTRNASVLRGDAGGATQKADLDRFFGSEITARTWVTSENLPGNAGDATQKADLVQTFWSGFAVRKKGRPGKFARGCRWCDPKRGHPSGRLSVKPGPLRSCHVSIAPQLLGAFRFVRHSCPENGSPRKCSGGCWWCGAKSGRSRIFRYTHIRKSVTSNCGVYQLCPGLLWCDPNPGPVTKLAQDFWVRKRGLENR